MIKVIAEHSVNEKLLDYGSKILDIGCRGFLFMDHFRNKCKYHCVGVDIDDLDAENRNFMQVAITGKTQKVGIHKTNDPQAPSVKPGNQIQAYTLDDFSKLVGVPFWDLIKMDIEGSELEVIMSLTKAPAKQLSIEFHLHTGIYSKEDVDQMLYHLTLLGYNVIKHELTSEHGAGFNYWDSLFILE
jgi:hypothetical protein